MNRNISFKFTLVVAALFLTASLLNGCGNRGRRVRLDAEDQFAKAKEKLDRRKYRDAIDLFEVMINQNRGSELIDGPFSFPNHGLEGLLGLNPDLGHSEPNKMDRHKL